MKGKFAKNLVKTGCILTMIVSLMGCGKVKDASVVEIELVQYKPEAAAYFEMVEEAFNASHETIHLTILSPNDATTILRTRFIREDYPDIIGIGGDINYSYYVDAEILADVSDYEGLANIIPAYLETDEALELIPTEGIYAVPYVANAAGILYNRDMFEAYGWEIPTNWSELLELCEQIQADGELPFYFGFKDTWTCLAPWNSMAVDLADSDTVRQVNKGNLTFTEAYDELAGKYLMLLEYGPKDPFAYGYNDACTAFARGEAAMYPIGSYAIPQILSVNPEMNIDSFVMPANDSADGNTLNSGIDLQFCVAADCKNKEATYEVLDFLLDDENLQAYIDNQTAVPCKMGEFKLSPMLDGMSEYIKAGNMTDFPDHYYPSEMAVDALLQTYLIEQDKDYFLENFDTNWQRYNRDIIAMVRKYEEEHQNEE